MPLTIEVERDVHVGVHAQSNRGVQSPTIAEVLNQVSFETVVGAADGNRNASKWNLEFGNGRRHSSRFVSADYGDCYLAHLCCTAARGRIQLERVPAACKRRCIEGANCSASGCIRIQNRNGGRTRW